MSRVHLTIAAADRQQAALWHGRPCGARRQKSCLWLDCRHRSGCARSAPEARDGRGNYLHIRVHPATASLP